MPQDTTQIIRGWSSIDPEEIEERLKRGDESLAYFFGPEEIEEMCSLAGEEVRVTGGLRPAIVVLPGIMGSLLQSTQGIIDLLWINPIAILRGKTNLLEMDETGERDADPRVYVTPTGIEMIYYTKFLLAVRKHVDVFQFPYDWRRDIRALAGDLHQALERWAAGTDRKFTLVGHSMGGLVSRAYLALYPEAAERRIERLIMLGTPNHGAPEAIRNLMQGNDMMNLAQKLNPANDVSRLVRRIPSIYQILPAPPDLWPADARYPANFDLYDAQAWPIRGLNQRFLDAGRAYWELLAGPTAQVPHIMIAGCGLETTIGVRIRERTEEGITLEVERGREGMAGGDGTVPLASALLPDAETYYVRQAHAKLPSHRSVIRAVIDLAHGGRPDLSPNLSAPTRAVIPGRPTVDPDRDAGRLREQIEEGTLTAADMEKLYFLL